MTTHSKSFSRTARISTLAVGMLGISATFSQAIQLEWSSQVFSSIVDSNGNTLDPNNFVFELGSFYSGFNPEESNVDDWVANWNTFDTATYNADDGFFTSSVEPYNGSNLVFEDMGIERTAFIWIRNSNVPEPGTEWLIVRASNWEFPDLVSGCCDNDPPIQWSVGELTEFNTPLWGNQSGTEGPGVKTVFSDSYDLQTYTFDTIIPEPSTALLMAVAGVMGVMRRKRTKEIVVAE